jgi:hypothetical protein
MSSPVFDWKSLFNAAESPYFALFRCGCMGVKLTDCLEVCAERNIPLREKDIQSWKDGNWNYQTHTQSSVLNPLMKPGYETAVPMMDSTLADYQLWPYGWTGTSRRWFPCNEQNMPMQKWGYSETYRPNLYEYEQAVALSKCGWVGQNMYAQPFIVIDIDGRGHGVDDEQVIEFGTQYRNFTETWENPEKPGSFHLYFTTERQIPIGHFPYAKLDLMGNQKNAAVYMKNKVSNGVPRGVLTEYFWADLKDYLAMRRAGRDNLEADGLMCDHEGRETP